MIEEILVRYVHFLGIISLATLLGVENMFIGKSLNGNQLRKLVVIDALYGISALVVFTSGLTLWFLVGKPSDFYTGNAVFLLKFSLFLAVALLSIIPTVFLVKNRKFEVGDKAVPTSVIVCKRLECVLLVFIPLLAVLMAKGLGRL